MMFGPDKFYLRMSLAEAFRDDLPAIEEGVFHLLPKTDLSGRQILFFEAHRRTGEGYTPESLVSYILVRLSCGSSSRFFH